MRRVLWPLFLGCCSFLGGVAAVAVGPRWMPMAFGQATSANALDSGRVDLPRLSERFEQVARKIAPSVVAIETVKPSPKPGAKSRTVEESGSGLLVRFTGQKGTMVVTNNHVVADAAAAQITVSLADNRIVKPTQVWADAQSDIALLRLDLADLPTLTLGDSESTRVGQWVLAFGSPFGLNQTVTHGIISARERGQISLGGAIRIKDFLQTDAAINPGSSGGPLVNLDGEVIGINTAIASHNGCNSGAAFSIPVNLVKRICRQLLEKGAVERGYLGLQVATSFEANDAIRLGLERGEGALVETVYPETPAAAAGLQSNDVVLEVDGIKIRNENHFINQISGLPAGQKIRLKVWRERKVIGLEAVVGDWQAGQSRLRGKSNP